MKVYLIYKDDAWHTKGSGELLRVADSLQKCYATAEPMELRKSNLEICAISGRANVVVKATSLTLRHGR